MRHLALLLAAATVLAGPARAKIPDNKIDVGVLGLPQNSASVAASMAADDFASTYAGPIDAEVHSATAPTGYMDLVKSWMDDPHIALVVDAAQSSDTAALAQVVLAHHRLFLAAAPPDDPAGPLCDPAVLKWGPPPAVVARVVAQGLAAEHRKRVFVLANESGPGVSLQQDLEPALQNAGVGFGGSEAEPIGAPGIDQRLGEAVPNGVDALILLMEGPELRTALLRAYQDGLFGQVTVLAPEATEADVAAVGLNTAHGLLVPGDFAWDLNQRTREFAQRFKGRAQGASPDAVAAAVYDGVLSTLKAARAVQSAAPGAVLHRLRTVPPKPGVLGPVQVRPDGTVAHDMYLFRVALPVQAQTLPDAYQVVQTIKADQAYAGRACGGSASP